MTQRELAKQAGCTIKHIGRLESQNNASRNPSLNILAAIANALGCSLSELCALEGQVFEFQSTLYRRLLKATSSLDEHYLNALVVLAEKLLQNHARETHAEQPSTHN